MLQSFPESEELAEHVESLVDDLGIEEPHRTRVVAGAQAGQEDHFYQPRIPSEYQYPKYRCHVFFSKAFELDMRHLSFG